MFGVFLAFVTMFSYHVYQPPLLPCLVTMFISLLFILLVTMHHKTNFLVNLYRDNRYSDTDSASFI